MAVSKDEKTEPATPRRRTEARSKGQVARSQDLSAAVLLFAGFLAISMIGPGIWVTFLTMMQAALTPDAPTQIDNVWPLAISMFKESSKHLVVFLIVVFVAVLVALYLQVGFLLTGQPLMPSLSKLNPISGFKRLLSMEVLVKSAINLLKLAVVTLVAYLVFSDRAGAMLYALSLDHHGAFSLACSLVYDLGIRLAAVLLVMALLDFAWQRYKHERDMRMTKEEVKDEFRNMEGDPKIKGRRREIQLQMALQRLRRDVPEADVIVTNPTHLAIAVKYDDQSMPAPKVVAKGADYMALRIRQVALEHGVPIVERKPLARAMYDYVEVGQYIPERFYRAIAEILAYVYELGGRHVERKSNVQSEALA